MPTDPREAHVASIRERFAIYKAHGTISKAPTNDDIQFLLQELDRREKEHQEELAKNRCKTCGMIGGNGTVEGDDGGYDCPDCATVTYAAHAEEIKEAKAAGWDTLIKYMVAYFVVSGTDGARMGKSNPFRGGNLSVAFPLAQAPSTPTDQADAA